MAVAERTHDPEVLFDEASDRRLSELYADCFTLILQLRAADQYGDPDVLRRRTKALLDDAEHEALRTGIAPDDIQMARFALVAFIDETIITSNWAQKDHWVSKPLQLELYDQYDAGEAFFTRLDRLRGNPEANAETIEIYYLCMALGFKGKYQLHEQERLREIIESTYEELRRTPGMQGGVLSPHGKPRGQVAEEMKRKVPAWVIPVAALLLGLLIYIGVSVYISGTADEAAQAIEQVTQAASTP